MAAEAPQAQAYPPRVILFDGVCVFCNRTARWLIARDPSQRLHYAALQSETAAALRARHPGIPEDIDTIVFVDASDGTERVHLRSDAMFRVLREIESPWRLLAWLSVLPRWLTDPGYRLFARSRYRLFGRYDACPVPTPEERARFLD